MMLEILREAEAELNSAVSYYEGIQSGLGLRLKDEIRKVMIWIANNPEVSSLRLSGYRRVNLKVFHYFVAYVIKNEVILILAVAHSHQYPEYWIDRKSQIS